MAFSLSSPKRSKSLQTVNFQKDPLKLGPCWGTLARCARSLPLMITSTPLAPFSMINLLPQRVHIHSHYGIRTYFHSNSTYDKPASMQLSEPNLRFTLGTAVSEGTWLKETS